MDADEGRLALPRPLPLELCDEAEELERSDRRRGDAPGDDRAEERRRVAHRADEQDGRRQQARVPRELGDADRVDADVVLLAEERRGGERDGADEHEGGREADEPARSPERFPAVTPRA